MPYFAAFFVYEKLKSLEWIYINKDSLSKIIININFTYVL